MHMTSLTLSQRPPGEPTILAVNNSQRNLNLVNSAHNIVGRLVGWGLTALSVQIGHIVL